MQSTTKLKMKKNVFFRKVDLFLGTKRYMHKKCVGCVGACGVVRGSYPVGRSGLQLTVLVTALNKCIICVMYPMSLTWTALSKKARNCDNAWQNSFLLMCRLLNNHFRTWYGPCCILARVQICTLAQILYLFCISDGCTYVMQQTPRGFVGTMKPSKYNFCNLGLILIAGHNFLVKYF